MRLVRNILTYAVLVASTGVTLAAAVMSARQGLPPRTLQDYGEIVTFLATENVGDLDDQAQRRMIGRIDESLHTGYDWQTQLDALSRKERQRAMNNLFELMRLWFLDKVSTYHQLPPHMKEHYIAREVRDILQWPAIRAISKSQSGGREAFTMQNMFVFAARAQRWKESEPPDSQERIDEFLEAARDSLARGFDPMRSR